MDFLTTISWLSPSTVGAIVVVAIILVCCGYLFWAWSEQKWPFK